MTTTTTTTTITLTIDGQTLTVPKGTTVYNAAKQLGIEIPIFCYLDRMPPFGACRMCLVEIEKFPKLQASCCLEATEGMVVKTQSQIALDGRKGIVEFLLLNHPLDCPICDRGGECLLQEHALQSGPGESRFYEEKRRFVKPIPLGPVLMLDRERCIVCARCTRFGDVVAGDHALEFIDRGYKTEVGTPGGGPAVSKFIGNTIMICPVGALTSQVYRFRARPWDNDSTPSTCTLCPVGCSMILDSRDGEIMRTRSKENRNVNDIWMCDKGWFGYEFTSSQERIQKPLIRRGNAFETASWEEALTLVAQKLQQAKPSGKLAAFGGNPLTVEENYLFQKLMRDVAGVNNVDHRVGTPAFSIDDEGIGPGMEIALGETESLAYFLLLGCDLTEEFPVIWLRLRQAINAGAQSTFIGHFAPEISSYLTNTILHEPDAELQMLRQHLPELASIANGKKAAIFVGRQYLNNPHRKSILSELLKWQKAHPNVSLNIMEGSGNSMGARFAGMRPDLEPLGNRPHKPGMDALQVLENSLHGEWEFLYVAGANPAKKFPKKLWDQARGRLKFLVVQDLFLTETAQQADVVLPTLSYIEKGGSFVNIEGRVQKLLPGKAVPDDIYSDAEIFKLLAQKLNVTLTIPAEFFEALKQGQLPISRIENLIDVTATPPPRSNGTLAASFAPALFDNGVRMKHDENLIQLARTPKARIHPDEGVKRGINDGDVVQLKSNENTISAKIKLDKNVASKTIVLPLGFDDLPVHELGETLLNGMGIEISA